jgi:hypothetical protein
MNAEVGKASATSRKSVRTTSEPIGSTKPKKVKTGDNAENAPPIGNETKRVTKSLVNVPKIPHLGVPNLSRRSIEHAVKINPNRLNTSIAAVSQHKREVLPTKVRSSRVPEATITREGQVTPQTPITLETSDIFFDCNSTFGANSTIFYPCDSPPQKFPNTQKITNMNTNKSATIKSTTTQKVNNVKNKTDNFFIKPDPVNFVVQSVSNKSSNAVNSLVTNKKNKEIANDIKSTVTSNQVASPVLKQRAMLNKPSVVLVKIVNPTATAVKPSVTTPTATVVKPTATKPTATVVKSPATTAQATIINPTKTVSRSTNTVAKATATAIIPTASVVNTTATGAHSVSTKPNVVKPNATVINPIATMAQPVATVVKETETIMVPSSTVNKSIVAAQKNNAEPPIRLPEIQQATNNSLPVLEDTQVVNVPNLGDSLEDMAASNAESMISCECQGQVNHDNLESILNVSILLYFQICKCGT